MITVDITTERQQLLTKVLDCQGPKSRFLLVTETLTHILKVVTLATSLPKDVYLRALYEAVEQKDINTANLIEALLKLLDTADKEAEDAVKTFLQALSQPNI